MSIYLMTRQIRKLLDLELKTWFAARYECDAKRRDRLKALSLKAHIKADELQHRIITAKRELTQSV